MSDNTIHVAAAHDHSASATLPPYAGAVAFISMAAWENGYEAHARQWTTDSGQDVVSLEVGPFHLTLTPEQWAVVTSLVASVVPQGVPA